MGLAGGVRHTNVGVHDGRTVDASKEACASMFVGDARDSGADESDSGHCYSCTVDEGSAASLVIPVSICVDGEKTC